MPLTGVFVRYPAYSSRSASIQTIEDRINGCFRRSMNGSALDPEDPAMRDMVAYLAFISRGIAVGDTVPGQGVPKVRALTGDTVAGATLFLAKCARCHGVDGNGTSAPATTTAPAITYPPLWGPRSFNIGAGMTRFRTAAGFIHVNMPFDQPGTLSEEEALNIAAYVVSRERPDFPGKERDWPRGDAPADAAYPTLAGRGGTAPH
jgi:thiosulfate dehydrogenase